MSHFHVPVLAVDAIRPHPNADRLSIVTVRGYEAVEALNADGSFRYAPGDRIVYVPEGSIIPDEHLRARNLWNEELGIGRLSGPRGNRLSPASLRGFLSRGLVWPLPEGFEDAEIGSDLSAHFGIEKYIPTVPPELMGAVGYFEPAKLEYDIPSFLEFPTLLQGEEIVVTEKLHGICHQLLFHPGANSDKAFGGDVTITSKGLGDQRMVFLDVPENASNPYVRTAREASLLDKVREWGNAHARGERVALVSEVFGRGVQDLHYGADRATIRSFDLQVGEDWLAEDDKVAAFAAMDIVRVPVLYRGIFDRTLLDELRRGRTTLGEGNIREGIVITATGDQKQRETDIGFFRRPQLKYHSPEYLLRKGGTEYR